MEAENWLGATGAGSPVLSPSLLGTQAPLLSSEMCQPKSALLFCHQPSDYPLPSPPREWECGLGGGLGERMRKAAFTCSGLNSHPSSSGNLSSLCLQIPRTYRILQIHRPHLALYTLLPVGVGAVGLTVGVIWTWAEMWRGIKVLRSIVHCWWEFKLVQIV